MKVNFFWIALSMIPLVLSACGRHASSAELSGADCGAETSDIGTLAVVNY